MSEELVPIGDILGELRVRMMAGRDPAPIPLERGELHWKCRDCMIRCECAIPLKHDRCGATA